MNAPSRRWVGAALAAGAFYFVSGAALAPLATGTPFQVRAWRLAAWAVSGIAFAAHIGFEHFRLRNPPTVVALHTSAAVALGAFAFAVSAAVRAAANGAGHPGLYALALVAWPAVTAVPAFVAALAAAAILGQGRPRE